jgi:glycosyltransferase involved in cell wall biosynthesis
MNQPKQLKILLSAFACHPEKGSEEGVAWNWLKELSQEHQVYALISTLLGQDEAVRAAVEKLPSAKNIHLIVIPFGKKCHRLIALFPIFEFYLHCVEWQKAALREAQKLLKHTDIDIVHHVTYATWTIPSFLWRLPKPFILGPVAGSQRTPLTGYQFLSFKGIVQEIVRMTFYFWARLPLTPAKKAVKRSNLVLCGNLETLQEVSLMRNSGKSLFMSEVGITNIPDWLHLEKAANLRKTDADSPSISLLWVAAFEPRKNFGLLLQALQILPDDIQWKLFVAGDGACLGYWQDKVIESGLATKVKFLGQIPYQQMAAYYRQVDIFVLPSLREGSPTVVIEAMANGLPVVALKLCGMASLLSEDCGMLVDVESKAQMVKDFAGAIERLSRSQDLRYQIGQNAYTKIKDHYTWEHRARKMLTLYEAVLTPTTLD